MRFQSLGSQVRDRRNKLVNRSIVRETRTNGEKEFLSEYTYA